MSRKNVKTEFSMEAFFVEITWSDGKSTGERTFVRNGVTTRQVLKDGEWVDAGSPPRLTRRVQSTVVRRKALPAPPSGGRDAL